MTEREFEEWAAGFGLTRMPSMRLHGWRGWLLRRTIPGESFEDFHARVTYLLSWDRQPPRVTG